MIYQVEVLDEDYDNGTMPDNVQAVREAVVGHRIVSAHREEVQSRWYGSPRVSLVITLDDGRRVTLEDSSDCCAFTELKSFLLHADKLDHAITGVGTTEGYTKWHIFADLGDVLELDVAWSCGNAFYYGYGFDIAVTELES